MEAVYEDVKAGELSIGDFIFFPWNRDSIIEVFHNDPDDEDFLMGGDLESFTIFQLPKELYVINMNGEKIEVGKLKEGDEFRLLWDGGKCEVISNEGEDDDILALDAEFDEIGVIVEKSIYVQKIDENN